MSGKKLQTNGAAAHCKENRWWPNKGTNSPVRLSPALTTIFLMTKNLAKRKTHMQRGARIALAVCPLGTNTTPPRFYFGNDPGKQGQRNMGISITQCVGTSVEEPFIWKWSSAGTLAGSALSLPLTHVFERTRYMATFTDPPECATMYVVLLMTRIAIRCQRDLGNVLGNVAGVAIEVAVCPGQRVVCLRVVIKAPSRPTIRVMAERTICP
jgi:hypothetical protein